jgi:hypothetical protein
MATEYYYFVTGLPAQSADDTKLLLTPLMFLHSAQEHLDESDFDLLELLLMPNDITNLVHILHDKDQWSDENTVDREEWEEVLSTLKEHAESNPLNKKLFKKHIPPFMIDYLHEHVKSGELKAENVLYQELFTHFYEWIKTSDNAFLKEWFRFDSDIRNITIAINCRKHGISYIDQLIGNNDLTEKLIKSTAGDFGLGGEYPMFEIISRLNDQPDIIEKEKGFDALRWKWIDNRTFFDYFTIPRILGYFIKLRIVYRWIHLSQSVGEKRFNQVLHDLETSFEFPEEFALNKR